MILLWVPILDSIKRSMVIEVQGRKGSVKERPPFTESYIIAIYLISFVQSLDLLVEAEPQMPKKRIRSRKS